MSDLRVTPLHALHQELGAKLVPFAGYEMPVQYPAGVMKEHQHCRNAAGLFDVSHMGQVVIRHPDGVEAAAAAVEGLAPVDVLGLGEGRQRYALFTNEHGGIEDDFMIANRGDHLLAVVNAACKAADVARMTEGLPGCEVSELSDRGLLALQGPEAETALEGLVPGVGEMKFMDVATLPSDWGDLWISRSGYTGEDGYEISVEAAQTEALARALLAVDAVEPIGLGARDSLRLESGLCLYGNDIDSGTTPVEAGLTWAIQKVRRAGGARAGGFPGAETILRQIEDGPARRRVGLRPEGRAPMREGTQLYASEDGGDAVGHVTSGAFGPTLGAPMSMGYVAAQFAEKGTTIWGEVRGKRLPATLVAMPFVPANVKR
ncbi:glycine cleavage system aminomethyltransferase GcvT [Roseovarius spongiae]|uniref:aminomethyltransferase n=1 Tax=Roseovarius spongiae TaxID=2320272 RepID=A0A3A8ATF2_9RHOB|nr:glycine cleavage system aminomethyltransferase GcvT [Roseovarius spongiae]RKF13941.1 glycine cleavage system aminomethyltransferase GcvT [Roseovarius spongiae]